MRKRVFTTALTVLLAACMLAGCGGGTNPGTTPGGGGTTPEVHVHEGTTYLTHGGACSCGETIPEGDHEWDKNNKCTVCGYELPVTGGLIYADVEGGLKVCYDWENASLLEETELVIPAYHDGKKVVEVCGIDKETGEEEPNTFATTGIGIVAVPNTVEKIDAFAFYSCASLEEAYIGGGTLGKGVFYLCEKLKKAVLPETTKVISDTAFRDCTMLYDFDIPSSVTEIGPNAFTDCCSLMRLTFPEGLTTLGDKNQIFARCCRLVEVYNRSGLDLSTRTDLSGNGANDLAGCHIYTDEADAGKFTEKDGFLFYTLNGVTSLLFYLGNETQLVLPEKDPDGNNYPVANYALERLGLVSVATGDGVTKLGRNAFSGNKTLLRVEIGKNVTEIGAMAFSSCSRIFEVGDFSDALEIVKGDLGNGMIAQNAVHVYTEADADDHGAVTVSGDYTFFSYGGDNILAFYNGSETELTLPALCNGSKYRVGAHFMDSDPTVTSIVFGNGVTEIGTYAFSSCKSLESVTFGNSLERIEEYAFYGTNKLTSVSFPASLTYIGNNAFRSYYEDRGLTSAVFAEKEGWTYKGWSEEPVDVNDPAETAQKLAIHGSSGDASYWQRKTD